MIINYVNKESIRMKFMEQGYITWRDIDALPTVQISSKPCEDAIDRQAVLEIIAETQARVKALPSVTPKQRTGKWNDYYTSQKGNDVFNCKLCGATFIVTQGKDNMNFCPNCGAKMEGGKNE